ncbi:hypothetical protein V8C86DRAFT_2911496 [Haematococcus lacustris]
MPELAPGDAGTSGVAAAAEVPSPNALPRSGAPERRKNRRRNRAGALLACVDLTDAPDSDPDDVQITGEKRVAAAPPAPRLNLGPRHPPPQQAQQPTLVQPTWTQPPAVPVPAPPSPERGYKCPICLDRSDNMSTTTCGHVFCSPCIADAIRIHKKCPKCRKPLTAKSVHKIFLDT